MPNTARVFHPYPFVPRKPKEDKRPPSSQRGYGAKWRKTKSGYLANHPLCAICGKKATTVDHIIPHKGDMKLFWDRKNWQPACQSCNSRKAAKYEGGYGNRRR